MKDETIEAMGMRNAGASEEAVAKQEQYRQFMRELAEKTARTFTPETSGRSNLSGS